MGQRSATRSVAAVMVAFVEHKTWKQVDLAREVGLSPEAVRKILLDLVDGGAPLESEKGHPHVYWRMARDWYPGGVHFRTELAADLLRELTHLPRSKARDRLLATLMDQMPGRGRLVATPPVFSRALNEAEEQWLPLVEEGAARKVPVFIKYMTASRGGRVSERFVSVHAIEVGPPARFVASCHTERDLRRFRVDNIVRARLDDREAFRECDPAALEAFRASSLDGYKGDLAPLECTFFVREPDSSWVTGNLLDGMRVENLRGGGIRVRVETSALLRLARFVVSLGDAAQPETPALAQAVAVLARGALEQAKAALKSPDPA